MKRIAFLITFVFINFLLFSQNLKSFNCDEGSIGFKDSNGKVIIECKYEQVNDFSEGYASVKKDGKWGFINSQGKEITPFKYDPNMDGWGYANYKFKDGYAEVSSGGMDGIIDTTGKEIIPCIYNRIYSFDGKRAEVEQYGFSYYVDTDGKILELKDKTVEVEDWETFETTYWNVVFEDGKFGFTDMENKEIVAPKYDFFKEFDGNSIWVKLNNKWSKIDNTGKELIPFKYDYVFIDYKGNIRVSLKNKWGIIDKDLNEIIECKYDEIQVISDHIFASQKGKLYLLNNGKKISLAKYVYNNYEDEESIFPESWVNIIHDNCLQVYNKDKKQGLLDINTGEEILKCEYDKIYFFKNNILIVEKEKKWALYNKQGKAVTDFMFDSGDYISYFNTSANFPDFFLISKDGKWGYIDSTGTEFIAIKYDTLDNFNNNAAMFELNGESGYVDKEGNEVFEKDIPAVLVPFSLKDRWGYCDTEKNIVFKPRYEEARPYDGKYAIVKQNGKFGVINRMGLLIIKPTYDDIYYYTEKRSKVRKDEETFYLDERGYRDWDRPADENNDDEYIPESNFTKVFMNNKYVYADTKGKKYYFEEVYDTVEVNNITELLNNIASYRCIILNKGDYPTPLSQTSAMTRPILFSSPSVNAS